MTQPVHVRTRLYWLACPACGWRGEDPRRLRKCPRCRGRLTLTGRLNVSAEVRVSEGRADGRES